MLMSSFIRSRPNKRTQWGGAPLHQGIDVRRGAGRGRAIHIHISPFLVTEVGQLNDDSNDGWSISTLQESDPMGYVLNNGW